MNHVYILGGLRSYIGVKDGSYKNLLPEDLAAEVLSRLLRRYLIKEEVNEFVCGNTIGTGGNIARLIALKAGLPESMPSFTIDAQCASSFKAMESAYLKIISGNADVIVAGGAESESMKPIRLYQKRDPRFEQSHNGRYQVAQFSPEEYGEDVTFHFGERMNQKYGISEKELNEWTLVSHQRAKKARKENRLRDITVSVNGSFQDEGIRDKMSIPFLERLPKILEGGRNSIGNISLTNDGAAFLILCSERFMKKYKGKPAGSKMMKVKKLNSVGVNPLFSPEGAMKSCDRLLESEGLSYEEIDIFEFGEAFSAIDVLFAREHGSLTERYNIYGGALAYGHPYGASGAILTLHLAEALKHRNGRYGIAGIAASGGMGMSILLERMG